MELIRKYARGQWDRVGSWIAFALAALLLLLGWEGTSDALFTTQQIPYLISGGLGGLLLSAIGATMWLSADLRDEWRKLDEIHEALVGDSAEENDDAAEPSRAASPAPESTASPVNVADERVAAASTPGKARRVKRPVAAQSTS